VDISIQCASVYIRPTTVIHAHNFYQLAYCKKTGGWITVGDTVYEAEARHVYFIKPGVSHQYEQCGEQDLLEMKFQVSGEFAEELYRLPDHFCPQDPAFAEVLFGRIAEEYSDGHVFFYDIIHCALRFFLIESLRQVYMPDCGKNGKTGEDTGETKKETWDAQILGVKEYIDNHLHENLTLDDLAEKAHFSKAYFVSRFKYFWGETPIQYINNQRYQRATVLLRNTDLSVSEISAKVGFRTPHYFSTFFKLYSGLSPKAFRSREED